ncbi:MAG: glycosyltransferase [Candidatus Curtissbacteria bacterium]|nr:glycosyltransferase [Candidatus Curtissbacteria bacterium]
MQKQIKGKLSVIIPNYNSPFCSQTITDILDKAKGDIEVIVNVEQKWPEPLSEDARVHYIHGDSPIGMRAGINKAVAMSKGEFIIKCDDHVMFGEGFDEILKKDHQPDWVQVPQRYALNAEDWKIEERTDDKYPIVQMYQDFPRKGKANDDGTHGVEWRERRNQTKDQDLVESPSMQGSCWFMTREYFDKLNLMDATGYGQFAQEAQEIGFKCWLSGGKLIISKKTFYAHLHKGKQYGRFYKMPGGNVEADSWSAEYWLNDRWEGRTHDFAWFIDEKFPGMPSWPADWKEQIKEMGWVQ